jgi:hypothetical protein
VAPGGGRGGRGAGAGRRSVDLRRIPTRWMGGHLSFWDLLLLHDAAAMGVHEGELQDPVGQRRFEIVRTEMYGEWARDLEGAGWTQLEVLDRRLDLSEAELPVERFTRAGLAR